MSAHGGGEDLRERPIGELLRELSEQTTTLVRQELELAKAELGEKGKQAGKGVGMFGGAGVVGLLAAGALTAAIIAALDEAMPLWAAALIVAAVYGLVAGVLAMSGKKQVDRAAPVAPEQTVESVKEDVEWARTRAQSARR
jgi:MFS family permease